MLPFGVAYTPRIMALSGIGWMSRGIHRRSDGRISNLSGKPTNEDVRSEAAINPWEIFSANKDSHLHYFRSEISLVLLAI